MTSKYALSLAIVFVATIVVPAQQTPTPPTPPEEPFAQTFSVLSDGGGFLGVYAEDISKENMGRYNLREAHGVGITQIVKDSPAEKAGLRTNDVILRLDGENVTSVRKLNRLVSEVAPDQSVRVVISRGGSEQELSATIGMRQNAMSTIRGFGSEAPQVWKWEGPLGNRPGDDLIFSLGNGRRIGISTMELTKQLADYFGISAGKGVLVTSVVEDGPAAKAGLRAGDVITQVDGENVDGSGDISRIINQKKDGDVMLTITRNKSQQTIRVTPREGPAPFRTARRAPLGRQIVIPRIELPTIPEMNISIPRMQLPTIPSINIQLPGTFPGVRVVRRASRPI
ncbi:MAG: PDZ domain-containing protein [Pyrinomonadaceae bacterium]